jgi:hydrogenase maturation protease
MRSSGPRYLVLGLGNDLCGDDGVGPAAARELRARCDSGVDVIESAEAGLALLELLEGYDGALILDAMKDGISVPGSIHAFKPGDFRSVAAPSPHYIGLPEVLSIASQLEMHFPRDVRILAMETEDPHTLREGFSDPVLSAFPAFVEEALAAIDDIRACVSHRGDSGGAFPASETGAFDTIVF